MKTKEEVLKNCTTEGNVIKLPNTQLERKLYQEVAKALELIGGKWNRKFAGFVFQQDPTELLRKIATGEKRNLKKEFQFFATPEPIADYLVELAQLKNTDIILEPSCGQGAIIKAINKAVKAIPHCYELMEVNRLVLQKSNLKFNLIGEDFFEANSDVGAYTKIIANPPFSKNQDLTHVLEMYNRLAVNGRLVSIVSTSWVQGSQKKQIEFREFLKSVNAQILDIEKGAFKESGTMIASKIIIINKKETTMKTMTRQEIQEKIDILKKNKKNPKANVEEINKKIAALQNELKNVGKVAAPKKENKEKVVTVKKTDSKAPESLKDKSVRFQIAYYMHIGKTREEIINDLGFAAKQYTDGAYHYVRTYKQQVIDFIKQNA